MNVPARGGIIAAVKKQIAKQCWEAGNTAREATQRHALRRFCNEREICLL